MKRTSESSEVGAKRNQRTLEQLLGELGTDLHTKAEQEQLTVSYTCHECKSVGALLLGPTQLQLSCACQPSITDTYDWRCRLAQFHHTNATSAARLQPQSLSDAVTYLLASQELTTNQRKRLQAWSERLDALSKPESRALHTLLDKKLSLLRGHVLLLVEPLMTDQQREILQALEAALEQQDTVQVDLYALLGVPSKALPEQLTAARVRLEEVCKGRPTLLEFLREQVKPFSAQDHWTLARRIYDWQVQRQNSLVIELPPGRITDVSMLVTAADQVIDESRAALIGDTVWVYQEQSCTYHSAGELSAFLKQGIFQEQRLIRALYSDPPLLLAWEKAMRHRPVWHQRKVGHFVNFANGLYDIREAQFYSRISSEAAETSGAATPDDVHTLAELLTEPRFRQQPPVAQLAVNQVFPLETTEALWQVERPDAPTLGEMRPRWTGPDNPMLRILRSQNLDDEAVFVVCALLGRACVGQINRAPNTAAEDEAPTNDNWKLSLYLSGLSDTGKSKLLDAVRMMFAPELVATLSRPDPRFPLENVIGSVLVVCEESERLADSGINVELYKLMMEGARMVMEHRGQKPITEHCPVFLQAGNGLPQYAEKLTAVAGRRVVCHFQKSIPPEKQDLQLPEKLRTARPAVLHCMATAYKQMRDWVGDRSPKALLMPGGFLSDARLEDRAANLPPLDRFIAEHVLVHPIDSVTELVPGKGALLRWRQGGAERADHINPSVPAEQCPTATEQHQIPRMLMSEFEQRLKAWNAEALPLPAKQPNKLFSRFGIFAYGLRMRQGGHRQTAHVLLGASWKLEDEPDEAAVSAPPLYPLFTARASTGELKH